MVGALIAGEHVDNVRYVRSWLEAYTKAMRKGRRTRGRKR